jgi:hypothetical protein
VQDVASKTGIFQSTFLNYSKVLIFLHLKLDFCGHQMVSPTGSVLRAPLEFPQETGQSAPTRTVLAKVRETP